MSNSGIKLTTQKIIPNHGGDILHGIKATETEFAGFGEAYFSLIHSGAVKAWKRHKRMTLNLLVPSGLVRFVVIDRKQEVREFQISPDTHYARLTISPGVWFGFQGLSEQTSIVMNIADIEHDPEECETKAISEFSFNWLDAIDQ